MEKKKIKTLREAFGRKLQENVVLANYTTASIGGPADALLVVNYKDELESTIQSLCGLDIPFYIIGSGSNVLFSDNGVRGVVIINHARQIKIKVPANSGKPPSVWAESGANLNTIARRAALRGLSGLEWATGIPGSIGGAVYGNAGAYGKDMQSCLILAEILHLQDSEPVVKEWSSEDMEFEYRSSILKQQKKSKQAVILSAQIRLQHSNRADVQAHMKEVQEERNRKSPPGANTGCVFKNPPGDFAARLIEEAGLKGKRIGGVEISKVHANFFINLGGATARDFQEMIQLAQNTVMEKFSIQLEPEIELLGNFNG